jgi:hypothetical protein
MSRQQFPPKEAYRFSFPHKRDAYSQTSQRVSKAQGKKLAQILALVSISQFLCAKTPL